MPALNYVWLPPLDDYQLQVWIACGLLGAGFLLSADVLFTGLARAFHGKVGMDTLCALSVIFTLADGLVLAMVQNREGQLPYTAAVLVGLFFLTHGTYHKKCGLRLACRTAAAAAEPYLLTLDEGKWNGRDTYCMWSGVPNGFGSQIQTDDVFSCICAHIVQDFMYFLSSWIIRSKDCYITIRSCDICHKCAFGFIPVAATSNDCDDISSLYRLSKL